MQHASIALALANDMIAARFGACHGVRTWAEYQAFALQRSTEHLAEHMAGKIGRTTGSQRRRARITLGDGALIIALPMNDSRTGATVWAVTEFALYLEMTERGADSAWVYVYKDSRRAKGQVRMAVPCMRNKKVSISRLIVAARAGQEGRQRDDNPFNLRQANILLVGNPGTPEGRAGTAKMDAWGLVEAGVAARAELKGRGYGYNIHEE